MATRENLPSGGASFSLSAHEAGRIIDEIQDTVQTHWRRLYAQWGVGDSDLLKLANCFQHDTF